MINEKNVPFLNGYYKSEEERDRMINEECRKAKPLQKYSVKAIDTKYGFPIDRIWINLTGGTNLVEMKHRAAKYMPSEKYKDSFIEVDKYRTMIWLYNMYDYLPIFITTYDKCDLFFLWVLPAIPEENLVKYENVKIKDRLADGGKKIGDRYGLRFEDAYVLDFKTGEIVQKPRNQLLPRVPALYSEDAINEIIRRIKKGEHKHEPAKS